MKGNNNYNLFFQFIETFLPQGFLDIDPDSPVMLRLEKMTEANNQFFFVADLLKIKILFTSNMSGKMMGIKSMDVDPHVFFTFTHPDDLIRHHLGRLKLFSLGQESFINHDGTAIISTNFRLKHVAGHYTNMLVQCYLFYTRVPYETVFLLQVVTDISWFEKLKFGFHFYTGNDLAFFRYPDEKLLLTGHVFTEKEFEIIRMIAAGLNSEQVAKKLFRSVHTINTHRRNILNKSGKVSTAELINDLKAQGIL